MTEYFEEYAQHYPGEFAEQPGDVYTKYVLGAEALAIADSLPQDNGHMETIISTAELELRLVAIRAQMDEMRQSQNPWTIEKVDWINLSYAELLRPFPTKKVEEVPLPEHLPRDDMADNILNWIISSSDNDLLDFLRWNQQRLQPLQERLAERAAHMQAFILDDVEQRLIPTGLLSKRVLDEHILEKVMSKTKVYVMDPFDDPGAAGHYDPSDIVLGVAGSSVDSERLYKILMHEYMHSLMLFLKSLRYVYGENADITTWIDEAYVEHLTESAVHGEPEIISPHVREDSEMTYSDIRSLLAVYIAACGIEVTKLGEAYCDPVNEQHPFNSMHLAETLETAGNSLFPELALGLGRTVTRAYNGAASPMHRVDVVSEWGIAIAEQSGCAFDDGAEVLDEEPGRDVFFVLEKVDLPTS